MDTTAIISSICGALIGTVLGAVILAWKSESGLRKVRKTAIKALDTFESYGKKENTYEEASAEFNNKLNVAEKRSILVGCVDIGSHLCRISRFLGEQNV